MLSFTKESTHYIIITNVWLAAMVLADHAHDAYFAAAMAVFWFVFGYVLYRREKADV